MAKLTYSEVNWEDKPSENTPINALNLGKMEQGIKDCVNKINANLFASDNVEFKFVKSGSNYGYLDAGGNFVPFKTTHTDLKTLESTGTTDMGVDHKYRYVDASNVYSAGYGAGVNAGKAAINVYNTSYIAENLFDSSSSGTWLDKTVTMGAKGIAYITILKNYTASDIGKIYHNGVEILDINNAYSTYITGQKGYINYPVAVNAGDTIRAYMRYGSGAVYVNLAYKA